MGDDALEVGELTRGVHASREGRRRLVATTFGGGAGADRVVASLHVSTWGDGG